MKKIEKIGNILLKLSIACFIGSCLFASYRIIDYKITTDKIENILNQEYTRENQKELVKLYKYLNDNYGINW